MFKTKFTLEQRKKEANRIRSKFADKCPVIVEVDPKSDLPLLDRTKFLVPMDMTMGQFLYIVCQRLKTPAEKAVFIFVNKKMLPTETLISYVYRDEKDEDGFLYTTLYGEHAYG